MTYYVRNCGLYLDSSGLCAARHISAATPFASIAEALARVSMHRPSWRRVVSVEYGLRWYTPTGPGEYFVDKSFDRTFFDADRRNAKRFASADAARAAVPAYLLFSAPPRDTGWKVVRFIREVSS